MPFLHSSILPFFHPSNLPSFHTSIQQSATRLIRFARIAALVSLILDHVIVVFKHHAHSFVSCSDSRLRLSRNELIKLYFYEGYEYSLIVCFLHFVHVISISIPQLKRVLKSYHLRRKLPPTTDQNMTVTSLVMVRIRSLVYITHIFE